MPGETWSEELLRELDEFIAQGTSPKAIFESGKIPGKTYVSIAKRVKRRKAELAGEPEVFKRKFRKDELETLDRFLLESNGQHPEQILLAWNSRQDVLDASLPVLTRGVMFRRQEQLGIKLTWAEVVATDYAKDKKSRVAKDAVPKIKATRKKQQKAKWRRLRKLADQMIELDPLIPTHTCPRCKKPWPLRLEFWKTGKGATKSNRHWIKTSCIGCGSLGGRSGSESRAYRASKSGLALRRTRTALMLIEEQDFMLLLLNKEQGAKSAAAESRTAQALRIIGSNVWAARIYRGEVSEKCHSSSRRTRDALRALRAGGIELHQRSRKCRSSERRVAQSLSALAGDALELRGLSRESRDKLRSAQYFVNEALSCLRVALLEQLRVESSFHLKRTGATRRVQEALVFWDSREALREELMNATLARVRKSLTLLKRQVGLSERERWGEKRRYDGARRRTAEVFRLNRKAEAEVNKSLAVKRMRRRAVTERVRAALELLESSALEQSGKLRATVRRVSDCLVLILQQSSYVGSKCNSAQHRTRKSLKLLHGANRRDRAKRLGAIRRTQASLRFEREALSILGQQTISALRRTRDALQSLGSAVQLISKTGIAERRKSKHAGWRIASSLTQLRIAEFKSGQAPARQAVKRNACLVRLDEVFGDCCARCLLRTGKLATLPWDEESDKFCKTCQAELNHLWENEVVTYDVRSAQDGTITPTLMTRREAQEAERKAEKRRQVAEELLRRRREQQAEEEEAARLRRLRLGQSEEDGDDDDVFDYRDRWGRYVDDET